MKQVVCLLTFCLFFQVGAAQKFGFIDGNFILNKMESYRKAQSELDNFSKRAETEVQVKFKEVADMKLKYQAEELVLTDEMKRERQLEIEKKEKEAQELQQKTFGYEGLLYLKKKELIGPVLEELNKAVEKVARKQALQVVYDKSSDFIIVYLDPRHDYTEYVLEELGLGNPEDNPRENANRP
ncbi:MAG: OmpH family outer membrane protein [Thermonemataceae bacterium]